LLCFEKELLRNATQITGPEVVKILLCYIEFNMKVSVLVEILRSRNVLHAPESISGPLTFPPAISQKNESTATAESARAVLLSSLPARAVAAAQQTIAQPRPATTKAISDELRKKIRAMVSTGVPTLAPRFAKLILKNFS
jgi:hypothetical protein